MYRVLEVIFSQFVCLQYSTIPVIEFRESLMELILSITRLK